MLEHVIDRGPHHRPERARGAGAEQQAVMLECGRDVRGEIGIEHGGRGNPRDADMIGHRQRVAVFAQERPIRALHRHKGFKPGAGSGLLSGYAQRHHAFGVVPAIPRPVLEPRNQAIGALNLDDPGDRAGEPQVMVALLEHHAERSKYIARLLPISGSSARSRLRVNTGAFIMSHTSRRCQARTSG